MQCQLLAHLINDHARKQLTRHVKTSFVLLLGDQLVEPAPPMVQPNQRTGRINAIAQDTVTPTIPDRQHNVAS
jgi:hypothetical protein